MKFGISLEMDTEARSRSGAIQQLAQTLSSYLESNNYGLGIEHFTVGLIVMKSRDGYENWYKPRKPRFKKEQKIRLLDGSTAELKNSYAYDIKLSDEEFEDFIRSDKLAIKVFLRKFLESLSNFDSPSVRKRDFNLVRFRSDIENFAGNL